MHENEHTFVESRVEMEEVLKGNGLGFLGLVDGDRPYVVPLNYSYHDGGRILVHCAHQGKKLDLIRRNPNVTFTVARQLDPIQQHGFRKPCEVDSESVVCFGTARLIEDVDERTVKLNAFNRFFRPDADDIPLERVQGCMVVEITVKQMTGRLERERTRTLCKYDF